jgi:hypothetical protein
MPFSNANAVVYKAVMEIAGRKSAVSVSPEYRKAAATVPWVRYQACQGTMYDAAGLSCPLLIPLIALSRCHIPAAISKQD